MTCSSFEELSTMIRPKITYRNTVTRTSVPPEERLARRMVECAFGILCNKWRIFHRAIDFRPDFCDVIVKTCGNISMKRSECVSMVRSTYIEC
jgi:hypothetical protein